MAKRIAFGQIVVLCTDAVISVDNASPGYMHPLHVAASTAFGALASVLALMIPFPGQSCYKKPRLRKTILLKNQEFNGLRKKKQRNLEELVCELKKLVKDAEMEPIFWYLPFRSSCYNKLVESLSNIADMLYFITFNLIWRNYQNLFQESVMSSLKYLEKANLIERGESREMRDEKFTDLEMGKLENQEKVNVLITENEEAECSVMEDKKHIRERMIRSLGALRFCISSMSKEIYEIEICIKEIVRWENNSCK